MQGIPLLLRRPKPYLDESLSGYLTRLADKNYYDSVRWIFALANLSKFEPNANLLTPEKHDLKKLSQITEVPESTLWKMAFPEIRLDCQKKTLEAFGETVQPYLVHKAKTKVCPACLNDKLFRRKVWDLAIVTSCPIHNCLLIDTCPQCRKVLTWSKTSLYKCKCGLDLRTIAFQEIEESEVLLSFHLHRLCNQPLSSNLENLLKGFPHPFLNLNLDCFSTIVIFFAGQFIRTCDTTGKFIVTKKQNAELHYLLLRAFTLFLDWPAKFYKFLDWRKSLSINHNRDTGIARDFGSFYEKLYTNFSAEPYSFLREEFENYLASFWDSGYFNSKLRRINSPVRADKLYIPATEAAQILGLSEAWVLKLAKQGIISGSVKRMGTRNLTLVKRESVFNYQRLLNESLTVSEVAEFLAVGRSTVIDLINCSCVKALRGPKSDGYRQWMIDFKSVENLLSQLSLLSSTTSSTSNSIISLSLAVRKTSGMSYTIGKLIHLALSNELKIFQDSSKIGLNQYYFLDNEINELIQKTHLIAKGSYLNITDVAILLKVKQEVIRFWVSKEIIKCSEIIEGSHVRRKFLKQDIESFRQDYITATELAVDLQTSPKKVVQRLIENQILPITGPSVDGGRQYLFRRIDTACWTRA